MKNNAAKQPKREMTRNTGAAIVHRTYKPRTPITRLHKKIMNDPFVFTV